MSVIFAEINPDTASGPTGFYVGAGVFVAIALGMLISGLHPRWRATAKWRDGISRSVFGTLSFSTGLMVMSAGIAVLGTFNQRGPPSRITLALLSVGAALILLGFLYDLLRSIIRFFRNHFKG